MKKIVKVVVRSLFVTLVIIQFIRPEKNNGGYETVTIFEKETKPSVQVASILKENCYDCHSAQTQYPWYAEVAPVSFWLDDHIKHGKKELSVSAWETYSAKKKDHKLEEVVEMLEKGEMPLDSYTWIHGNLSKEDSELLIKWAMVARLQYEGQLKVSAD